MKMKSSWSFITALLFINGLVSCTSNPGAMSVTDAWARPMPAGQNGAAYFMIQNHTNSDDLLLAATSDIAASTEIHLSSMNDKSVMSMSKQEGVKTPMGDKVVFEPGGLHVMLIDLQRDLIPGESFPLTLNFEVAGEITVPVDIPLNP